MLVSAIRFGQLLGAICEGVMHVARWPARLAECIWARTWLRAYGAGASLSGLSELDTWAQHRKRTNHKHACMATDESNADM